MRYSFISEGESHYICMHAETAMYLRLKGEGFAEQCLQNRILFRETTEETVDQEFSEEKLFLDLSYLQVMEEGVAELLINAMQKWISCNCEVYLIKTEPELYEGETITVTADTAFAEEDLGDGVFALCFEMTDQTGESFLSDLAWFTVEDGTIYTSA